jgi:hypothetical protein
MSRFGFKTISNDEAALPLQKNIECDDKRYDLKYKTKFLVEKFKTYDYPHFLTAFRIVYN